MATKVKVPSKAAVERLAKRLHELSNEWHEEYGRKDCVPLGRTGKVYQSRLCFVAKRLIETGVAQQ